MLLMLFYRLKEADYSFLCSPRSSQSVERDAVPQCHESLFLQFSEKELVLSAQEAQKGAVVGFAYRLVQLRKLKVAIGDSRLGQKED